MNPIGLTSKHDHLIWQFFQEKSKLANPMHIVNIDTLINQVNIGIFCLTHKSPILYTPARWNSK